MPEGLDPNKTFPSIQVVRNCAKRAFHFYPVTEFLEEGRKYGIPIPGKKFRVPDKAPEPGNQVLSKTGSWQLNSYSFSSTGSYSLNNEACRASTF